MRGDLAAILGSSGSSLVKLLVDKGYDKRKLAAVELEKVVRAMLVDPSAVARVISALKDDFLEHPSPNFRMGGLIGIASVAIALSIKPTPLSSNEADFEIHLQNSIPAVVLLLADSDPRVRYFACESLYNILQVSRSHSLVFFPQLFDACSKLFVDADSDVRRAAGYLDHLLKDLIVESNSYVWDRRGVFSLITDRLSSHNSSIRQLMLSWLRLLDIVPGVSVTSNLPIFLEALFALLGDELIDISKAAETQLDEFHEVFRSDPDDADNRVDDHTLAEVVQIVCDCAGRESRQTRAAAAEWLRTLVLYHVKRYPNLLPPVLGASLPLLDDALATTQKIADECIGVLLEMGSRIQQGSMDAVIQLIEPILRSDEEKPAVRSAALKWLPVLFDLDSDKIVAWATDNFAIVIKNVKHPDTEVVGHTLKVLPLIAKDDESFSALCRSLLRLLHEDSKALAHSGAMVRSLLACSPLFAESFFLSVAAQLKEFDDEEFKCHLIQMLNWILLCFPETAVFRQKLRKDSVLFSALLPVWSESPVSTIALCLWVEEYSLSFAIIRSLAERELSVDILLQLDHLVHLVESPVFSRLRLHLLEVDQHPGLLHALKGLSTLLPQGASYHLLLNRLQVAHLGSTNLPAVELDERTSQLLYQYHNIKR